MKRFSVLLVLAVVAFLATPLASQAGPWLNIPEGYLTGGGFKVLAGGSAIRDTVTFATSNPNDATTYIAPESVSRPTKTSALVSNEKRLPDGVILASKVPFRIKVTYQGGATTGTTLVPVDTMTVARGTGRLSVEYPCQAVIKQPPKQIIFFIAANDTIWGTKLYER